MFRKKILPTAAACVLSLTTIFAGGPTGSLLSKAEADSSHSQAASQEQPGAQISANDIVWMEQSTIDVDFAKYVRMVKITKGEHAGELLVTYQDREHGGDFWATRSKDGGLTWSTPEVMLKFDGKFQKNKNDWSYIIANCNIIELDDGRLMMVHQERGPGTAADNTGIKVRYSSDGGETWTADQKNGINLSTKDTGQLALQAGGWEPRAIQVPHDENGDGNNDIYIFYTNSFYPASTGNNLDQKDAVGRGVSYVVSYDDGQTWHNPSTERYTGGIVHRNFDVVGKKPSLTSEGGMPTPFVLPGHRLAFVAEGVDANTSPWLVASDPGDWDFTHFLSEPWSSIEFKKDSNHKVYPDNPNNLWQPTTAWGGAPYATVLSNGKVTISQNSAKRIRVWIGDSNARGGVEQERPFGNTPSFYSFIEPIDDAFVLVGAHHNQTNDVLLRRGFIVDVNNLDELLSLGKQKNAFANEGIYNSLTAHVAQIQKHQDDAKNVANGLKSLKNELNAQSGKQIDKVFADQALSIVATLSAKY
jgi:hypothetical protein